MVEYSISTAQSTKDDIKNALVLLYKRTAAVLDYSPNFNKIKSTVKLYRPTEQVVPSNIEHDYGLQKLVENTIEVQFIEGNHISMLQNSNLCNAINGLLL